MRKIIAGLLEWLPVRKPYLYLELPRRNFFIGFGWSMEGHTRPVKRGGVTQTVERTECFREFKLRLSLLISLVFVCATPPRQSPGGDPSPSDWPNIYFLRPSFFYVYSRPKKIHFLGWLMEKGYVKLR